MKTINFLFLAFIAMSMNTSCSAQTSEEKETKVSETGKVEVYYFHFTRRCATCNAVEQVSKETVAGLDGEKVIFADYNLDEEAGKAKAKDLQVS